MIQNILLGKVRHKITTNTLTQIIISLVCLNLFSVKASWGIISLVALNPISDRKVDADDSPAARIPQTKITPKTVGITFIEIQIMTLSGGSISGLIRFAAAAL